MFHKYAEPNLQTNVNARACSSEKSSLGIRISEILKI